MDQLDSILVDVNSDAPALGSLEGSDYGAPGECRLFLSCPDVDVLVQRLKPWLEGTVWQHDVILVKRYGIYTDPKAPEKSIRIKLK
jgi:hypothetical protein